MSQNKNTLDKDRENRYHHYNNNHEVNIGDKGRKVLKNIDDNNPVIERFLEYAAELAKKYDRHERIFKYNRDITIESKRIIFLLHTLAKNNDKDFVIVEAKIRLDNLVKTLLKFIADELSNQDLYQYLRAYSVGLQEYIEAITFYYYLCTNRLLASAEIEKNLTYKKVLRNNFENTSDGYSLISSNNELRTFITPNEYILGITDLTGELVRTCVNNVASGDITSCYQICNFVKEIYIGFVSCVAICSKEVRKKLYFLKQSLIKMENVCYAIKVRGSEIPQHMLIDAAIGASKEYPSGGNEDYKPY